MHIICAHWALPLWLSLVFVAHLPEGFLLSRAVTVGGSVLCLNSLFLLQSLDTLFIYSNHTQNNWVGATFIEGVTLNSLWTIISESERWTLFSLLWFSCIKVTWMNSSPAHFEASFNSWRSSYERLMHYRSREGGLPSWHWHVCCHCLCWFSSDVYEGVAAALEGSWFMVS